MLLGTQASAKSRLVPLVGSRHQSKVAFGILQPARHAGGQGFLRFNSCGVHRLHLHIARASDDKDELPWERKERLQNLADGEGGDLPFAVYLLASAIVAIAAVGSIFEIINRNPIFGVLPPSSPFWLPILGTFGVTGLPSAGFLFFKAISKANADSDRQNKADGY